MPAQPDTDNHEHAILKAALEALRALGVAAELSTGAGETHVRLVYGDKSVTGPVLIKRSVTPANLGMVAQQWAQLDEPLLVTEYVTAPVADRLRELKIEFADTFGNAYIHTPPLLIWVTGRKPDQKPQHERVARIFQPGGLKLLFALLSRPALLNASYREIARAADVALGTVGWVMTDLKEAGFLDDPGHGVRTLGQRRSLLDQWVEGYARLLRPKFFLGRYRAPGTWRETWQDALLSVPGALWGGESAAVKMGATQEPFAATMYLAEGPAVERDLVKTLGLIEDPAGEIELRQKFWRFELAAHAGLTPPLLVYADLLATAEVRNLASARVLHERYLTPLIDAA